jgi:hypothetical protein
MMEKDDAVSTVIALMLVLGIISTLIAIYSAVYLPGLKQQSEIEHSREVADAFARFGSDIEHVVSQPKSARFSEPFSLGGGDILLSPVRSSGSLTITQAEEPLVRVTVDNGTQTVTNVSLVNISYVPSFTTWEPQGYLWEYGFVAVTKDSVVVPQSGSYNTIPEARADSGGFLCSFVDLTQGTGGDIEITLVNLFPKKDGWFMTGSGRAALGLNVTVSEDTVKEVTEITFTFDPEVPGMQDYLDKKCRQVNPSYTLGSNMLGITSQPVTLRTVNVEVGVW